MRRTALAVVLTAAVSFTAPIAAANASPTHGTVASHACTRTSSGTCIRGGQFCPQAKYGKHGWDAQGRRYTCKGSHTHPHWEK